MEMLLLKTFLQVILITIGLCALVYLGYFDEAHTELGKEHYAEDSTLVLMFPAFRHWLKMPLNTLICVGYLVVGIYWLVYAEELVEDKILTCTDGYVMMVFSWMAVFYGPLQCLRIVTQLHPFAVLDQWVTLPFFAWVIVWSYHCSRSDIKSWSPSFPSLCVGLSVASYCLTLVSKVGFEISLGIHIAVSAVAGFKAYATYSNMESKSSLIKALACCFGFVILKLLDLELKSVHSIFSVISGHFLSKICDIFQIYYVNVFFLNIMLTRYSKEREKNKKKTS